MADLHAEVDRLSQALEDALAELCESSEREALAEFQYRKARAKGWLVSEGTAKQREDAVNALTADERYRRDLAASQRQGALESLRSRRQQLSACQSVANADRAEAEIANYGPDMGVAQRRPVPPRPAHPAEVDR